MERASAPPGTGGITPVGATGWEVSRDYGGQGLSALITITDFGCKWPKNRNVQYFCSVTVRGASTGKVSDPVLYDVTRKSQSACLGADLAPYDVRAIVASI